MFKNLFEKNLVNNEFLIFSLILLLNFIIVLIDGEIPEGFKELSLLLVGFVGRGALNNIIVDKK